MNPAKRILREVVQTWARPQPKGNRPRSCAYLLREISNKAVGPELKSKSEWFYASLPDRTYNGYVDEICSSHLLADCAEIDNRDAYPTVYLGRVCFSVTATPG